MQLKFPKNMIRDTGLLQILAIAKDGLRQAGPSQTRLLRVRFT